MRNIKNVIFNNIGLKALSLVLAVGVWFYIAGELNRLALEEGMGLKGGIPYKIAAKTLPIIIDVRGDVVEGYRIDEEKILITPQVCNVIGVKRIIDKINVIKTVPINVSEYTRTVTMRVSLQPPTKGIKIVDRVVSIVIPIEKIN